MTRMVGEFPELQGVMGRYYANASGEKPEIAAALDEFYRPRFAGDAIAEGEVARVLGVAERFDTLAGIFAVGMKPSGNKDPFALRRAALGLARTLIEGGLDIDFRATFQEAIDLLPDSAGYVKNKEKLAALNLELNSFVLDRLRAYYVESASNAGTPGVAEIEAYEAIRALEQQGILIRSLVDFDQRLRAVVEFAKLPEAAALAAANKRIGNILRQAGVTAAGDVYAPILEAGAESALAEALAKAEADIAPLAEKRDYVGLLKRLAALREPVDRFFDGVMVMVDDAPKRVNRLNLLCRLRGLFLRVADISVLPSAAT
jgi:glycyl-tRNA synthetase beta chain